jgi:hypothetical protein
MLFALLMRLLPRPSILCNGVLPFLVREGYHPLNRAGPTPRDAE